MNLLLLLLGCVFAAMGAVPAAAQGQQHPGLPGTGRVPPRMERRHGEPGDGGGDRYGAGRRALLERRFRERGEQIVRSRLQLTDGQVQKLRAVNARLEQRRRALLQQQRSVQRTLRDELALGKSADQGRVGRLMQQAHELQRQRFELQQDEQRELAGFLTPVQQAQYWGLQQQLRKKLRELRGGTDDPAPPGL